MEGHKFSENLVGKEVVLAGKDPATGQEVLTKIGVVKGYMLREAPIQAEGSPEARLGVVRALFVHGTWYFDVVWHIVTVRG